MRMKTIRLFWAANSILILVGWVAACYAYPRLPDKVPLWFNFFGDQVFLLQKSPLFFSYAAGQTAFSILFLLAARLALRRQRANRDIHCQDSKDSTDSPVLFGEELVLLALIFFNLIFIHIQTSLIFLSYNAQKGFNPYYFILIFLVILLLIPYYRLRAKMLKKQKERL